VFDRLTARSRTGPEAKPALDRGLVPSLSGQVHGEHSAPTGPTARTALCGIPVHAPDEGERRPVPGPLRASPAVPAPSVPGAAGDSLEREAGRAGDEAMRPALGSAQVIPRPPAGAVGTGGSSGFGLDAEARRFFEPRLSHNFAGVRIHADAGADASARALHARAYTLGEDIVFARGRYAPGTPQGRALLAHELAHVAQQSRGLGRGVQRAPDDPTDTGVPPDAAPT